MDLTERVLEAELMDAPDLKAPRHRAALRALQRINRLSGTASVVSQAIIEHCGRHAEAQRPSDHEPPAPLRILDLACGGGDVTLAIGRKLAAAGLNPAIEAWDRSPTAIEHATEQLAQSSPGRTAAAKPNVRFVCRDVLQLDADRRFDVVMCTLFLHHLDQDAAVQLLGKMYRAASQLVLVDDLRRTWSGYRLAQLGCYFLTRSPIVHFDGPQSVRAAFTESELLALSRQARLPPPAVSRHWPQRVLVKWTTSR